MYLTSKSTEIRTIFNVKSLSRSVLSFTSLIADSTPALALLSPVISPNKTSLLLLLEVATGLRPGTARTRDKQNNWRWPIVMIAEITSFTAVINGTLLLYRFGYNIPPAIVIGVPPK